MNLNKVLNSLSRIGGVRLIAECRTVDIQKVKLPAYKAGLELNYSFQIHAS